MRRSLVLGLLVLACRGGIKAPETIPVAPGVLDSIAPAIAPPAVDTSARAAVQTPGRALIAAGWPLTQRVTPVSGEHAMVVTSHPLASDVGVEMLRRGGNAVDAAVAVAFALAVVHPVAGNIGGGGFMVTRMHDGAVGALDFRETAPTRATRDMYVDTAGNAISSSLTGHHSVAVPGTVAGGGEAAPKIRRRPPQVRPAPLEGAARARHRSGPRRLPARRPAQPCDRTRSRAPGPLPRFPGAVSGGRSRTAARNPLRAARARAHAAADRRQRRRDVLNRQHRSPDCARDGARRRVDHAPRPGALCRQVARPRRDQLSRLHDLYDAAAVRRGRDPGGDSQCDGGVRSGSAVRQCRAAAPPDRGDAPGVHRPQRLAG